MENLPTPLSRVELYLAKACGMDVTVPEQPLGRLEQFLAILAGDTSITMPTPIGLTEQWLAYVLGITPSPLLAVEGACLIGAQKVDVRYFAVAASMPGATLPEAPQNRAEMYWAHIAGNPPTPGILKYVTGKYFYLTDVVSGIEELQYVKGDTYQQTYSGKNIIDFATIQYSDVNDGSGTRDGATFTVNGASSGNWGGVGFGQTNLQLKTNTTYTLSATVASTTNPNGSRVYVGSGMNTSGAVNGNDAKAGERTVATFTTPNSIVGAAASIRLYPMLAGSTAVFKDIMLEESATATSYEPYTGGTPAPNPDYPQNINVVTGAQTVTVSNGVDSEDFTINLGSIELCKIGTYQDKIFNNDPNEDWYDPNLEDNAWYVHKATGKYTFDGTENWETLQYGTNSWRIRNLIYFSFDTDKIQILSNIFIGIKHADRNTAGSNVIYSAANNEFDIRNTEFTTQANVQTATNGNYIYYAIATPTDTKITDATLVGQLEALNSAPLPKPIANITVSATGTNLTPYLTIAYYGSDE